MKRVAVILAFALLALAYIAGYWPQHRQLTDARVETQSLQKRLAAAESRVRLGDLLGQQLRLSDAVAARNYSEAATLSSAFFDGVRAEVSRADRSDVRAALQGILDTRDRVTTAIAGTDPALPMVLKDHERTLRQALGYAVSAPS